MAFFLCRLLFSTGSSIIWNSISRIFYFILNQNEILSLSIYCNLFCAILFRLKKKKLLIFNQLNTTIFSIGQTSKAIPFCWLGARYFHFFFATNVWIFKICLDINQQQQLLPSHISLLFRQSFFLFQSWNITRNYQVYERHLFQI